MKQKRSTGLRNLKKGFHNLKIEVKAKEKELLKSTAAKLRG